MSLVKLKNMLVPQETLSSLGLFFVFDALVVVRKREEAAAVKYVLVLLFPQVCSDSDNT